MIRYWWLTIPPQTKDKLLAFREQMNEVVEARSNTERSGSLVPFLLPDHMSPVKCAARDGNKQPSSPPSLGASGAQEITTPTQVTGTSVDVPLNHYKPSDRDTNRSIGTDVDGDVVDTPTQHGSTQDIRMMHMQLADDDHESTDPPILLRPIGFRLFNPMPEQAQAEGVREAAVNPPSPSPSHSHDHDMQDADIPTRMEIVERASDRERSPQETSQSRSDACNQIGRKRNRDSFESDGLCSLNNRTGFPPHPPSSTHANVGDDDENRPGDPDRAIQMVTRGSVRRQREEEELVPIADSNIRDPGTGDPPTSEVGSGADHTHLQTTDPIDANEVRERNPDSIRGVSPEPTGGESTLADDGRRSSQPRRQIDRRDHQKQILEELDEEDQILRRMSTSAFAGGSSYTKVGGSSNVTDGIGNDQSTKLTDATDDAGAEDDSNDTIATDGRAAADDTDPMDVTDTGNAGGGGGSMVVQPSLSREGSSSELVALITAKTASGAIGRILDSAQMMSVLDRHSSVRRENMICQRLVDIMFHLWMEGQISTLKRPDGQPFGPRQVRKKIHNWLLESKGLTHPRRRASAQKGWVAMEKRGRWWLTIQRKLGWGVLLMDEFNMNLDSTEFERMSTVSRDIVDRWLEKASSTKSVVRFFRELEQRAMIRIVGNRFFRMIIQRSDSPGSGD